MAYLSIHNAKRVTAFSLRTLGAPITINIARDSTPPDQITLFTGNQAYADALVTAINGIVVIEDATAIETEAA